MTEFEAGPEELPFRLHIPSELEEGTYTHAVVVWHTAYDFALDFAVTQLPQPSEPDDPDSPPVIPARVVARIRIPPTLVFDLIRAISANMETYEKEWGEIGRPRRREEGSGS